MHVPSTSIPAEQRWQTSSGLHMRMLPQGYRREPPPQALHPPKKVMKGCRVFSLILFKCAESPLTVT